MTQVSVPHLWREFIGWAIGCAEAPEAEPTQLAAAREAVRHMPYPPTAGPVVGAGAQTFKSLTAQADLFCLAGPGRRGDFAEGLLALGRQAERLMVGGERRSRADLGDDHAEG